MLLRLSLAALIAFAPLAAQAQDEPAPEAPAAASAPPPVAPSKPPPPPPTPEEIAAARAEGDRVIAEARAEGVFSNVTDGRSAEVLHDRSGLKCSFEVSGRATNRINIYDHPGIPRGDDVSCTIQTLEILQTVYATRYNPPIDSRQAITEAAAAINQRWPGAKWYEGTGISMSMDRTGRTPLPQTIVAHYVVKIDRKEHYTQARVTTLNGWTYKLRMTVPLKEVMAGQLLSEMTWMMLLTRLVDGQDAF